LAAHVELDPAGEFDDGFGVMAVLGERVFDGLGAIDKEPAIAAVLFLGDPVPTVILADEDEGESSRAARGRFDKFHVSFLPKIESRAAASRHSIIAFDCIGSG
jgi:hypothetical protein